MIEPRPPDPTDWTPTVATSGADGGSISSVVEADGEVLADASASRAAPPTDTSLAASDIIPVPDPVAEPEPPDESAPAPEPAAEPDSSTEPLPDLEPAPEPTRDEDPEVVRKSRAS
jgi:hypothetical protein